MWGSGRRKGEVRTGNSKASQKQARKRSTAGIYAIRRGQDEYRLRVEVVGLSEANVEQDFQRIVR